MSSATPSKGSKRKICVVTGTRAEYGLLRFVMEGIRAHPVLELQVIATGTHLSPKFGNTYQEIEADGIAIDRKIDIDLKDDSAVGVARSMALALQGCAKAYDELKPDLVLVLGDRFEILAAAEAAMLSRIPLAHIQGGEVTEGAMDEAMRHAISKMAQLHFVAAEEYRNRVIQLGEEPSRVHLVGAPGVDAIAKVKLLSKAELEKSLDFTLGERSLLITFHPATLEQDSAETQMKELLAALEGEKAQLIFTMPNADPGSRALFTLIEQFVAKHQNAKVFTSLGAQRYLSALQFVDAVVGNSSSGLIEVPHFKKPTINIGERQTGRLKAASVIDCAPERKSIQAALTKAASPEFQQLLKNVVNPYGAPGASEKIVRVLVETNIDNLLKKRFYDLPMAMKEHV